MVLRWTSKPIGESIVDIVLSLNTQAEKLFGSTVATASYSDVKSSLTNFDQIGRKMDEVENEIKSLEGHPGEYLRSMVNGFRYFARSLQGDDLPYTEYILNIQELPLTLIRDTTIEKHKDLVDRGLTDLGYKGTLKEKSNHWRHDTLIHPNNVTAVAESFREKSKIGTLKRVIELPEQDGIDNIKSIRGVFWSGYSKYEGNYRGNLTFNIDRPWSEPILAQIMTHEGYPGHQAFYCRWDYLFQKGKLPLEASYYLMNSPTNALFEGGPENACRFLGWDQEEIETEGITLEQKNQYKLARDFLDMQRMVMTNACYLFNNRVMTREESIHYMISVGNITEIEANNCFRFYSDSVHRTYYPSYYYGRWLVGLAYDAISAEKRPELFNILYDTPHTTNTFIDAISELTGSEFKPFESN